MLISILGLSPSVPNFLLLLSQPNSERPMVSPHLEVLQIIRTYLACISSDMISDHSNHFSPECFSFPLTTFKSFYLQFLKV